MGDPKTQEVDCPECDKTVETVVDTELQLMELSRPSDWDIREFADRFHEILVKEHHPCSVS